MCRVGCPQPAACTVPIVKFRRLEGKPPYPSVSGGMIMTVKSTSEKLGQGVGFERIRRITGYLVGTMDKWNDAKRAEERDRVKHGMNGNA